MTITGLDSLVDGLANLAWSGLPGTKAQLAANSQHGSEEGAINLRDLRAGVESNLLTKGHDDGYISL